MYNISNLGSVAFLQGNTGKNIHDMESTSLCRGLKKRLFFVVESRIVIKVPKLASKVALST